MKLMPASRAFATIRAEAASSVGPPNIMVPRQIGETFRPLRPSGRYCMGVGPLGLGAPRNDGMDCFVAKPPLVVLQYLKHAARHGDTALLDGHLGRDENQAAGGADHAGLRQQDLADLAGLDEMGVEL